MHGAMSDFPPLAALFLTHFDDIKGQSIVHYVSLDDEREINRPNYTPSADLAQVYRRNASNTSLSLPGCISSPPTWYASRTTLYPRSGSSGPGTWLQAAGEGVEWVLLVSCSVRARCTREVSADCASEQGLRGVV